MTGIAKDRYQRIVVNPWNVAAAMHFTHRA